MMINQDKARELIAQYKRKLQIGAGLAGQDELYKWDIITKYHGKLDPSREDAVTQISKLNIANLVYPYAGNALKRFSKEVPNEYRPILEHLFAEDIPVNDRIKRYYEETKVLYATIQKNDKDKAYQDERTAAALLTIYKPEKYAFFMASHYETAVRALGVEPMPTHNRYEHYLSVLQELIPLLNEDTELISMIHKDTEGLVWSDMLLADDMLYQTIVFPCQAYVTYQDEQGWWTYENQMSVEDWKQVLSKIYTDHRNWINYLLSYMEMPDYTASCVQMGEHMGVDAQSVNSTITHIGQEVNKQITRFRVVRERNYEPTYYPIIMLGRDNAETKNFDWKLRPELVQALQELGYEKQGLFTWIPFFGELAEKILPYRNRMPEVMDWVYNKLDDKFNKFYHDKSSSGNGEMDRIDPFTIFSIINRGLTMKNRQAIASSMKSQFGIESAIPEDFDSVPVVNQLKAAFTWYDEKHLTEDGDHIWDLLTALLHGEDIQPMFDTVRQQMGIRINLSMALYWIRPYDYLSLDSNNRNYLAKYGVHVDLSQGMPAYADYMHILQQVKEKMNSGEIPAKSFPELSYAAWQVGGEEDELVDTSAIRYFLAGTDFGSTRSQFDRFVEDGIWEGAGNKNVNALIETLLPGDVLIIKSTAVKARTTPFIRLKAIAVVQSAPVKLADRDDYQCKVTYTIIEPKDFDGNKYGKYRQTLHICNEPEIIDFVNSILNPNQELSIPTMSKYQEYIDLLVANKNLILTGAPGTGKTYMAKEIAKDMGAVVEFVQFHPSYDYTDFVEGLRPKSDANGAIGFERKDGVFKTLCKQAAQNLADSLKSIANLEQEGNVEQKLDAFLNEAMENETEFQLKTGTKFTIANFDEDAIIVNTDNEKTKSVRILMSEVRDLLVNNVKLNAVKDITAFFNRRFGTQQASYEFVICNEVRKQKTAQVKVQETVKKKPYILIIDEVNRGDFSKIFGELFFAIDPGYRGVAGRVKTQYSNIIPEGDIFRDGFYVPENVYILATMNDIDRSVESMDFAIRRRFAWKEVKAEDTMDMLDTLDASYREEAKQRLTALNEVIAKDESLGAAYQIGASFMCKLPLYKGDFERLWELHIRGTLTEYTRGMRNQTEKMEEFKKAYDM